MLLGLHHVTALAGQPQASLNYYTQRAGLHLVKRTVNFDEPGAYHLYLGDAAGRPGTLLTLFPGYKRPARRGAGQAVSLEYRHPHPEGLAGDPDGLPVEFTKGGALTLQSITLCQNQLEPTAGFLEMLGFERAGSVGNRHQFALVGGKARIDVLEEPGTERGRLGAGAIHHVAFRVADEAVQLDWRQRLIDAGVRVSPVKDRLYFHSIYFREPGGVLFEIATDGPGFLIDEAEETLGSRLCLPPWLEPMRESIETRLNHDH